MLRWVASSIIRRPLPASRTSPAPRAALIDIDLAVRPRELVAAWRADTGRLVLAVQEAAARQQRIQVRLCVIGLGVAATITGRAVKVVRQERCSVVEIAPDDTRVQALERLVAIASAGAQVTYPRRAPRLLAAVPAVVFGLQGPTYMTTYAVSDNGCGLAWTGAIPEVGAPMEIRLGAGREVASFCAEVRWTAPSRRAPTVGVHFAAGERDAWARMLANLKRSGAPPA